MFRKVWGRQLVIALGMALVIVLVAATASFAAPSDSPNDWWCNGVVVQHGQTLSGIAAHYGVSWQALAAYNGIGNPNYVRAGQCLSIPPKGWGSHYYSPGWNNNCCGWGWNNCCTSNYYQPTGHWVWQNGCWVYRYY